MTIVSVVNARYKRATLDEGLRVLHAVIEQTRARPGCISAEVAVDVNDPTQVHIVERWESVEADTAYREWRRGEGLTPEALRLADFRDGASDVWVASLRSDI
ncbi:MAG: antibiotic biosynthesis monooxygenase [Mycetocola sp.]